MRLSWRLPYPWMTGEVVLLAHQTLVEVTLSLDYRCGHTAGISDACGDYLILGGQVRSHCWYMRLSWRLPYPWITGEVVRWHIRPSWRLPYPWMTGVVTLLVYQTLVEVTISLEAR
jgi:hypothetical protein